YLTYNSSDLAFAPYGTYWKFMKKLCMSEFLNGKMLDQLLPIRKDEINRFLQMIVKKSEVNEAVNVTNELLKLTNSIVMKMSIGKSCFKEDDEAHKVTERVRESAMVSGMFNLADYFWFCKRLDIQGIEKRLKDVHDRFDNMMENIIKEHEEGRSKLERKDGAKDVLDALLTILDPTSMRRLAPHSASIHSELQRHGLRIHSVEMLEAIQYVPGSKRFQRSESENAGEQ
ncbi:cytochrome p450 93a1-like protein, partial [Trifolium pratense]